MNITTILDESLRIEYKELDKFLARYDLTSDEIDYIEQLIVSI